MGTRAHAIAVLALLLAAVVPMLNMPCAAAMARQAKTPISRRATRHATHPVASPRHAAASGRQRSATQQVTQYLGSRRRVVTVGRHHRYHYTARRVQPAPRYAYPLDFFMVNAPDFDQSPLAAEQARNVEKAFKTGTADHIPARALVRAGVAHYYPMRGGIFWRREPVTYLVVHSTETGIALGAKRVIDSWTSMGRRHPGAQYVVDRDGTIYQAVDPDLGTVHVNIFKTLPGINNDNSIGIEMVHSGRQTYTTEQRTAVIRLVHYLQDRYKVSDDSVITHRYAQQGDHTDPVAFNWDNFLKEKQRFRSVALATRMSRMVDEAETAWQNEVPSTATTYLQIHTTLPINPALEVSNTSSSSFSAAGPREESEESSDLASVDAAPPPAMARQPGHAQVPTSAGSPALRGEIEVDPKTAGLLLRTSIETATQGLAPQQAGLQPAAATRQAAQSNSEVPEQAGSPTGAETPEAPQPPASQEPAQAPEPAPDASARDAEPVQYFIHQPTPIGPPAGE